MQEVEEPTRLWLKLNGPGALFRHEGAVGFLGHAGEAVHVESGWGHVDGSEAFFIAVERRYQTGTHSGGGVMSGAGRGPGSGRPLPSSRLIGRTAIS